MVIQFRDIPLHKLLVYALEALLALVFFIVMRLLPLDTASAACGWVGRTLGPKFKAHKTAWRNLSEVMPELSEQERQTILTRMWDNIGRSIGEYPHLASTMATRYSITGKEFSDDALKTGKPVLFMSGHFGNLEMSPLVAAHNGLPLMIIYRPANNPMVDFILRRIRASYSVDMKSKGISGAMGIVRAIKSGQHIGMLVDQKMNEGIPVPFFGRDAMTAPAIARFALKYGLPILPARAFRTQGAHFHMQVYPPIYVTPTGNDEQDVYNAMVKINTLLESWVREDPAQWFWVHKRWGK